VHEITRQPAAGFASFAAMLRFGAVLLGLGLAFAGCKKDPPIMTPGEGELPPLPPASGTAIGYLVDNASQLSLSDDQLTKLKDLDRSLAARNDVLDTQLRTMEKPDVEPAEKGKPPPRHNNAPGAQVITSPDAQKLHEARKANDKEALDRAFALLDPKQQETARRLLDERGIAVPGSSQQRPPATSDSGVPLEP
jgi:hypothetical protein